MKASEIVSIEAQVFSEEWYQNFGAGFVVHAISNKNKLEQASINVRGEIELSELKKLVKMADNWGFDAMEIKAQSAGMQIKFSKK